MRALHDAVADRLGVIRTEFGRFGRQVSGYSLEHLLPERGFDVAAALVGSEGTLGVLLAATVRLVRAPRATVLVALGYPTMADAADAAPRLRRHAPTAVEGLDARLVDVVRRIRGPAAVPELPRGAGWLLVECAADIPAAAADLAGEGCVHVRIDFPLGRPGGVEVFRTFLRDAARLVAGYGGSMSGEHGDRRARAELLPLMYSAEALAAFGAVKRAFDPDGLLNPGVLVDPAPITADLRPPGARPLRDRLAFAYHDDAGDFSHAVHRCVGWESAAPT